MTPMQKHAIEHPLARAIPDGIKAQAFRRIDYPWSLILTVNK